MPILLVLGGCSRQPEVVRLNGQAMGTGWHVTYMPAASELSQEAAEAGIGEVLEQVEHSMSNWREDSEISRFNRLPAGESMALSADFAAVLELALEVGEASAGAYDVTVGPLVQLWGFGPGRSHVGNYTAPEADAIAATLANTGQRWLQLESTGRLRKLRPVQLDFSSVAKGFGVDRVAEWLAAQGVEDFLVEVGGELRLSGLSPRGDLWRIAIEKPDAAPGTVARAMRLSDAAVATSGDYRNYYEADGVRYSHSIDPRSGQPVSHDLVSVTVVDPSAARADAWATALSVLGPKEGARVAEREGLAVYFILRDGDSYNSSHSGGFTRYLEDRGTERAAGDQTL